ncbi:MAG TPA: FHA domain-containing protein [Anaerolineales bacterium]|nr:FHA domain-containing protein [Anaerolineales bacterium]
MSGPFLLILRFGMTLSLYLFLGWAFLFLWRSFKTESELLATRKTPPLSLSYTDPKGKERTRHFREPKITLGRDPHSDIYLENETVSAHHIRLTYHHGQWWLEDLKSTNGSTLNGEEVKTPTIIIDNDEIRCGEVPLRVHLATGGLSSNTQKI